MTTLMRNNLKKQRSQVFCTGVEPPETDMSFLLHQAEEQERLGFESEFAAWHEEVKSQFEH